MEYKNLFIDTNYYCAYYNPQDSCHDLAHDISSKIDNYFAFTSNFVLLETYTVLSQRSGKKTSLEFGEYIQKQKETTLLNITPSLEKETWEIFTEVKNKNVSYVDCSIMALAKRGDINTILTFDSHFSKYQKKYGFFLLNQ